MKRMSLKRFGQIVARVLRTLPDELKPYLHNVTVHVEEEPDARTLQEQGLEPEESLYGLFAPMDLPALWSGDAIDLHDLPHQIIIYKRPLEEDFPDRRQLLIEIRKTVIHELAHHFGFTERDLERFDANPDPFGDLEEEAE